MGEDTFLIEKDSPKNLEHFKKLKYYDQPNNFIDKIKNKITKKNHTRPHTIAKWAKILGTSDTNPNTRDFLMKLVDKDALIKKDDETSVDRYYLDKNKLGEVFYNSPYYNRNRKLFLDTINEQEPNKTVQTVV